MKYFICAILLTAAALAHTVTLNWQASSTSGVTYNVWRSTTQGSGYAQLNTSPVTTLTYKDKTAYNGATYYYVVTSFDGKNNSVNSNQVAVGCYCHIKNGVKVCHCYIATPAAGGVQ